MKKIFLALLKLGISGGLIYWILSEVDMLSIWKSIQGADRKQLVLSFLLFFLVYWFAALRLRALLEGLNIKANTGYLIQSFSIGLFFSNLLPSTIGGDASRMIDVWRLGASKSQAISVISLDRVIGLLMLLIMGFVASLLSPEIRFSIPQIEIYLGFAILGVSVLVWFVFGKNKSFINWLLSLPLGPLSFIQKFSAKIVHDLELYRGNFKLIIITLCFSALLQSASIIHFTIITEALNMSVTAADMFIIIPISTFLLLAPISINGIGLREAIFVYLFAIYSVDASTSIAFAWVALGFLIFHGILGGIVFALRRRNNKLNGSEITGEQRLGFRPQ